DTGLVLGIERIVGLVHGDVHRVRMRGEDGDGLLHAGERRDGLLTLVRQRRWGGGEDRQLKRPKRHRQEPEGQPPTPGGPVEASVAPMPTVHSGKADTARTRGRVPFGPLTGRSLSLRAGTSGPSSAGLTTPGA